MDIVASIIFLYQMGTNGPQCRLEVVNFPTEFTEMDLEFIKQGVHECPKRYKYSPCLVKIEKVGPVDYQSTCGQRIKGEGE